MSYFRMKHSRGLAAIEFLAAVPALLLLLVGMSETGNALVLYNTMNKMVQNGIRYATTDIQGTATYDTIADEGEIKNLVVYGNIGGSGSSKIDGVTTNDVTVTHSGGYVTITIAHTYTPLFVNLPNSSSFSVPLSASAVMRTAP
ncbi:TadE/TadG family type IV pilus assembly protein [Vibrio astriarenae]|uniref:TadE/TadG family type IV pilus assembly protein n=1 Tax=Vibrio astriarenae TaxID=1481923 RepID=UPI0037360DFB